MVSELWRFPLERPGSQGAWVDDTDAPERTASAASKLRMIGAPIGYADKSYIRSQASLVRVHP
jgi:hypothetical protein